MCSPHARHVPVEMAARPLLPAWGRNEVYLGRSCIQGLVHAHAHAWLPPCQGVCRVPRT